MNPHLSLSVPGIKIGHAQNMEALTGCTVILCEGGAVPGIDRRGGGTTTRQADAFEPWHVVEHVQGILLTGGSAFGLGAHGGVLQYLEERGIGFSDFVGTIPSVGAAGLFDLGIGDGSVRPDPEMAYQACVVASSNKPEEGCVGAGTGATVGKILGYTNAMKSGIGMASLKINSSLFVEAIVAVNAGGDVIDPTIGKIIAGVRAENPTEKKYFVGALNAIKQRSEEGPLAGPGENTVIGAVLTNAKMTKVEATKISQMAHDGLARVIQPIHTMYDGDVIFTLATGPEPADVSYVGAFAAEAVSQAVLRSVLAADSLGGLPASNSVPKKFLK